jgi:hypothetical protein
VGLGITTVVGCTADVGTGVAVLFCVHAEIPNTSSSDTANVEIFISSISPYTFD